MNIAIDTSPIIDENSAHSVRGAGFYIRNLKDSLLKYVPDNEYTFFRKRNENIKKADVIHYPYFDPFFLTLPFKNSYKTVVTVHDLTPLVFPSDFPPGIKGNIKWKIQKMLLQKIDVIITDSHTSKKDIMKIGGIRENKIQVVYLAASEEYKKVIKSDTSTRFMKKKYNIPDKFLLYVGDVTPNKNLPRLMEALYGINVPLVMVGKALVSGYDKSHSWNRDLLLVNDQIARNTRIIRLGFMPNKDLLELYNRASALIMPSLYEGFGLPILEAMQCGCPVITTRGGSLPEVAGSAAYYVDPFDIQDIAKGILYVVESPRIQKELSLKGLEQAKKFSWRKTALETNNVYRKIYNDL